MDNYYKNSYKKFLDGWGYDAQSLMCIEEMSELTKALCKYKRFKWKYNCCYKQRITKR